MRVLEKQVQRKKNRKGLGRKRVKVGECWSWLENLKGRGCWSLERCWSCWPSTVEEVLKFRLFFL